MKEVEWEKREVGEGGSGGGNVYKGHRVSNHAKNTAPFSRFKSRDANSSTTHFSMVKFKNNAITHFSSLLPRVSRLYLFYTHIYFCVPPS